ncbi:hypothetical protein KIK84_08765 [Curvibacter sp. CHRR-16]|uniref:hypothetical protein n=1 Tax=Curvibacter sp. CHRR-16 TaxID=2835872 RepID=UPI001BDA8BBC|nr:hypothetical protein [Curvibacter sp. CHRR-16]MBT0570418.1 hypothetical protein [Curvibacter sp. CHRR-16]
MTVIYISTVQIAGVDFWLQAKIGEIIINEKSIPPDLRFPFTEIRTEKFNAHEWLASIIFYFFIKFFGENNLPFIATAFGIVLFCAIYSLLRRMQVEKSPALILSLIGITLENYRHTIRPEIFSTIFLAFFIERMANAYSKRTISSLFPIAILSTLWTNIHGSFILAPIIAGIYLFSELLKLHRSSSIFKEITFPTLAFFVVLLSCLINPFGIEAYTFALSFSSDARLANRVTEWMPTLSTRWRDSFFWYYLLLILTITWIFALVNRKKMLAEYWFLLAFFSFLAIKAIRFPVYLSTIIPIILSKTTPQPPFIKGITEKYIYPALGFLLFILFIFNGNMLGTNPTTPAYGKYSDELTKTLLSPEVKGNVLTTISSGCELVYTAYPKLKPSIDCRVDSYGFDYAEFNQALLNNSTLLDEFVERYDVKFILMEKEVFITNAKLKKFEVEKWDPILIDRHYIFLKKKD